MKLIDKVILVLVITTVVIASLAFGGYISYRENSISETKIKNQLTSIAFLSGDDTLFSGLMYRVTKEIAGKDTLMLIFDQTSAETTNSVGLSSKTWIESGTQVSYKCQLTFNIDQEQGKTFTLQCPGDSTFSVESSINVSDILENETFTYHNSSAENNGLEITNFKAGDTIQCDGFWDKKGIMRIHLQAKPRQIRAIMANKTVAVFKKLAKKGVGGKGPVGLPLINPIELVGIDTVDYVFELPSITNNSYILSHKNVFYYYGYEPELKAGLPEYTLTLKSMDFATQTATTTNGLHAFTAPTGSTQTGGQTTTAGTTCTADQVCDCTDIASYDASGGKSGLTECSGFDASDPTSIAKIDDVVTDTCVHTGPRTFPPKKDYGSSENSFFIKEISGESFMFINSVINNAFFKHDRYNLKSQIKVVKIKLSDKTVVKEIKLYEKTHDDLDMDRHDNWKNFGIFLLNIDDNIYIKKETKILKYNLNLDEERGIEYNTQTSIEANYAEYSAIIKNYLTNGKSLSIFSEFFYEQSSSSMFTVDDRIYYIDYSNGGKFTSVDKNLDNKVSSVTSLKLLKYHQIVGDNIYVIDYDITDLKYRLHKFSKAVVQNWVVVLNTAENLDSFTTFVIRKLINSIIIHIDIKDDIIIEDIDKTDAELSSLSKIYTISDNTGVLTEITDVKIKISDLVIKAGLDKNIFYNQVGSFTYGLKDYLVLTVSDAERSNASLSFIVYVDITDITDTKICNIITPNKVLEMHDSLYGFSDSFDTQLFRSKSSYTNFEEILDSSGNKVEEFTTSCLSYMIRFSMDTDYLFVFIEYFLYGAITPKILAYPLVPNL